GRDIAVEAPGDIDRSIGLAVTEDSSGEQVRARAVTPRIPVADENTVVDPARGLIFLPCFERALRAAQLLTVEHDFHGDRDAIARGRDFQRAHVQRVARDLSGFAAVE